VTAAVVDLLAHDADAGGDLVVVEQRACCGEEREDAVLDAAPRGCHGHLLSDYPLGGLRP
jgi:hypothetical protein